MPDDGRPNPDALIAAAVAAERGRLKIFLGAAPGVGKTWEMLVQARRRKAEGVDVVAGVVETHGRAGTIAQLDGLPALPLKEVAYRGQILLEFDLEAALARHPGLLLVDELAHTNAPGSRHAKRWEDVALLVRSGLTVWATLNVQHLESLNDDVARITGVRVTETLPDAVLEMADEIELIDVTPAELRRRLQDGEIYRPETAGRALDGFFREGNLTSLREMALRRTAAHVDDDVRDWMRRSGVSGAWPSGERVLALIGGGPAGDLVARQAKRLADALHAPWVALHIEQPGNSAMQPPLSLAAQLGATLDTRGGNVIETVLAAARECNATHIVLGRARAPWWRRPIGRTLANSLLQRAPDVVIHIVPDLATARPGRSSPRRPEAWWNWLAAALLVAIITAGGWSAKIIPQGAMGMIYLAGIVATATLSGMRLALAVAAASFLAWDFFFIPPIYTITIGSPDDLVALLVFAIVALLSGGLASRVRDQARAAQGRIEGLRRIGAFSRKLGEAATEPDLLAEIAHQAADLAGRALVLAPATPDSQLDIRAAYPPADTMDAGSWAAAQWAWTHAEPAGRGTSTLPGGTWRFMPLGTVRARLGVLGVRSDAALDGPLLQAIATLADQSAVAWERVLLVKESARTTAMEETQRLRTTLLASLGHDLRTPLTGIRGAAGTLRAAWEKLPDATRVDLLDGIEEDVARMTRFLANIADLTRLESGQINPRLAAVAVAVAVDAAVARLPGEPHIGIRIPEPSPYALADPALLEQVLVNVLENAVKYSPANSLVRLDARIEGGTVLVWVTDEGIGIPPGDLTNVFDSFFRAKSGDRAAPGTGLGLGLAIARGMIEAMGGSITAESPRPGAPADGLPGTRINLRIPLAAAP